VLFRLRFGLLAPRAGFQCRAKPQIGLLPSGQTVIRRAHMTTIIAERVVKARDYPYRLWVGVDAAQHPQSMPRILVWHRNGMVALLPEVIPAARQHGTAPIVGLGVVVAL